MKGQLSIDTLYAYIQRDVDGTEGVCAMQTTMGWLPLVGADLQRAASYEPQAQMIANATGRPVELVHFSKRDLVKQLTPNRMADDHLVPLDEKKQIFGIT